MRRLKDSSFLLKSEHQIIWAGLLGLLVAVGLGLYGDIHETGVRLAGFRWQLVPVILGLTMFNYLLRSWRWQFFLKSLGVQVEWKLSWWVFVSGLAMTVTPGRLGELIKSYFLKKIAGVEMSATAPLVVFERLSDGLAMIVLMSGGLFLSQYGLPAVGLALAMAVGFIWLLHQRRLVEKILAFTLHLPYVAKYFNHLNNLYQSSARLVHWRVLLVGWLLSLLAWASEGVGFYLILLGLGFEPSWTGLMLTLFVFGFAAIAGFATLLPGGLGVAEGTMVGLLVLLWGADNATAAAATLLVRLATLWFGVGWGLAGIFYLQKHYLQADK